MKSKTIKSFMLFLHEIHSFIRLVIMLVMQTNGFFFVVAEKLHFLIHPFVIFPLSTRNCLGKCAVFNENLKTFMNIFHLTKIK